MQDAERRLEHLDSQSGRQEAKLQKFSPDTFKAYQWVLKNQDKFRKEVFGPPVVTCSVTDPKYANALETLLQRTDMIAFTTQCNEDFRTLQRALFKGGMRLHDISIKTCSVALDTMKAPLPDSELQRLGFDGWAKDYLSGPEPVLAMLCSENRLNQTPVGLRDISEAAYAELENSESGVVSSWVSGKHVYQVTRRREYGAKSTRARQVRAAQAWTSQPVDASLKQHHQQTIHSYKRELDEISEKAQEERAATADVVKEHERVEAEAVCHGACSTLFHILIVLVERNRGRENREANCTHAVPGYS